ncbi:MAG: DotU family type IV/VI secretion system protein [Thermoguttaceae bacterium]|jgi:type VI secretion system protein ImpK|nr:DotU family type IV/VI secretion system protein [Thermoguttaceae bacterium]
MTPEFASAVDPVFLYVLDLLDRIERGEPIARDEERIHLRALLERVESAAGQGPDARLAKYALVCWIDELLILLAPWEHREWWKNNSLEWELFKTQLRAEKFFTDAKDAAGQRQKNALEVFYLAVVLGFRGLYGDEDKRPILTVTYELPETIEDWARHTAMTIQLGRGRPAISAGAIAIEGAPPLDGPFTLIWAALAGLVLVLLNVMVLLYFKT